MGAAHAAAPFSMKQGKRQRSGDSVTHWCDGAGRHPLLTPPEELHLGRLIRAWQDHPDGPADAPAAVQRRGLRARNRMVQANLRLVANVANRKDRTGPPEDYLQAGALGLVRAAEKFDPEKGYKFSTYAYWWILQAMGYLAERQTLVYVPAITISAVRKGVYPAGGEFDEAVGRVLIGIASLDQVIASGDGDASTLGEMIPAVVVVDPLEQLQAAEALEAMHDADPEGAALLELNRIDGANQRVLADLEGVSTHQMRERLIATRERLRQLPEVAAVLAA